MADSEDARPTTSTIQPHDDHDISDETQDFRFITALADGNGHQLPKRGEKDFEPHGTRQQDGVLEASRAAMHGVLDYTRVHIPKGRIRAVYWGEGVRDDGTDDVTVAGGEVRDSGLGAEYPVFVERPRGPHFKTMGKQGKGLSGSRMWLLPEEALYLVERGNLDLWWPARSVIQAGLRPQGEGAETTEDAVEKEHGAGLEGLDQDENVQDEEDQRMKSGREQDTDFALEEQDEGIPLSLQAAYALFVGEDGQEGKISMQRYEVYANLKRTGYAVRRAPGWDGSAVLDTPLSDPSLTAPAPSLSLFARLFGGIFAAQPAERLPLGPLVQPGFYRSYNTIYSQLSLIDRHKPLPLPTSTDPLVPNPPLPSQPELPFRTVFAVYKPTRLPTFAKTSPGVPDFLIAVTSARDTALPSLSQMTALLESTPFTPPDKTWTGGEKRYQRLKHGFRNVVLAVVDQGVISYLRLGEGAFSEERLYEGFSGRGGRGGKRGGGRGGRGRGKGRGR